MEYRLVRQTDAISMNRMVTKLLKEGWELYGSPSHFYIAQNNEYFIQALTKKDE